MSNALELRAKGCRSVKLQRGGLSDVSVMTQEDSLGGRRAEMSAQGAAVVTDAV